ncbi:MAG: glycerol-3-phosphate 1-O-acyltransferase PlsY [Nitrosomonadales bacterium]|jgi:glycerol-3-phosphate acyltransferase PlsY|nr:glycerol-3-phosphate 1-O-acyltransferase PlsY [Nitrosomonadales bacterium]MBT6817866.1 glycerol-3-phosphate 1-O-acyltransferase PlsY [Nitrosomonadales bacterium]
MINQLLIVLFAYLVGSLSSGIIISQIFKLPDPRTMGSKNPGATNVMRTGNKKAAIFTLLGDLLKGTLVLMLAKNLGFENFIIVCVALAVLIGHIYPVFYKFQGGKGVATAVGILIALNLKLALIVVCIWLAVFFISRYSSLSAIVASISAPLIGFFIMKDQSIYCVAYALITIIILLKHHTNIKKLISGTELKFKK